MSAFRLISLAILTLLISISTTCAVHGDTMSLIASADVRMYSWEVNHQGDDYYLTTATWDPYFSQDLIRFHLPELPVGIRINSAILRLTNSQNCPEHPGSKVFAYRVTDDWDGIGGNWANSGGKFEPRDAFLANPADAHGLDPWSEAVTRVTFDITPLVRDWYNGRYPNYGVMLGSRHFNEGWFWSSNIDSLFDDWKPTLIVDYTVPTGPAYVVRDLSATGTVFSDAFSITNGGVIAGCASLGGDPSDIGGFLLEGGSATPVSSLGGDICLPFGLSPQRTVAGGSYTANSVLHAFMWQSGTGILDLGSLIGSGGESCAWAVNDSNAVVGHSDVGDNTVHAFVKPNGDSMQDLGSLGGILSYAFDINSSGNVVGSADVVSGDHHACLWAGGTAHELATLGGYNGVALALNSWGAVVGYSEVPTGEQHMTVWYEGSVYDFGSWGGVRGEAYDVNEGGATVGRIQEYDGTWRACLWAYNLLSDLNMWLPRGSDLHLETAYSINDFGQIVGTATVRSTGEEHSFLLSPVYTLIATPVLESISQTADKTKITVDVELRRHGGAISNQSANLNADGILSLPNVDLGNYDIRIKASHWLAKIVRDVVVTGATATIDLGTVQQVNGDCNGDNQVGTADLTMVRKAYGSTLGTPTWNPSADLNEDGQVGTADLNIVRKNYGKSGDRW